MCVSNPDWLKAQVPERVQTVPWSPMPTFNNSFGDSNSTVVNKKEFTVMSKCGTWYGWAMIAVVSLYTWQ